MGWVLSFKIIGISLKFLVFTSDTVSIYRYKSHKQISMGSSIIFKSTKESNNKTKQKKWKPLS